MNKKQLIVAWGMSCIISILFLFIPKVSYVQNSLLSYNGTFPAVANWSLILDYSMPVLIIGSLLIYTLRDKKK